MFSLNKIFVLFNLIHFIGAFEIPSDTDNNQHECTTPDGLSGHCIDLQECKSLLRLLQTQMSSQVKKHLRKSLCRYEGKKLILCCPNIKTIQSTTLSTTTTTLSTTTTTINDFSTMETIIDSMITALDTVMSVVTTSTTVLESTTQKPLPIRNIDEEFSLPSAPECGISSVIQESDRIVGGSPAEIHSWPWIAVLGYKKGDTIEYLCGGTLITSQHILTAAHCVARDDLYLARLGEHNIASDDDQASPKDYLIEKRIIHSEYNPRNFQNDISLIKLKEKVKFSDEIRPVCLPSIDEKIQSKQFNYYSPFIVGWGTTEYQGNQADILQQIQLRVLSNEECTERFTRFGNVKITENNICALDHLEVADACQGDSGGPMMLPFRDDIKYEDQTWFQIGVVSFGYKCAIPEIPGVYTRISQYSNWITMNLNNVINATVF